MTRSAPRTLVLLALKPSADRVRLIRSSAPLGRQSIIRNSLDQRDDATICKVNGPRKPGPITPLALTVESVIPLQSPILPIRLNIQRRSQLLLNCLHRHASSNLAERLLR